MEKPSSSSLQQANFPLSSLPLFHGLTGKQRFLAQNTLHRKQVPAGHVLMSQKQAGEIVYIIAEGAVRICVRRGNKNIIIGLRGVGDILGEMSVIDGDQRSATVITQTDCELLWVSRTDFWEVLWPMPQFSLNLTTLMAKRIRTLTAQLEAMATLPVQGRLALLLVGLARDYGCAITSEESDEEAENEEVENAIEIPFRLTQADLANMIAATRVQVNQVFCGWKKRKLIRIQNSRIHLLDQATLRDMT